MIFQVPILFNICYVKCIQRLMSFQKPENALKRCDELLEVGRPEDALEVLKQALLTRRFRFSWSESMETIMERYITLSYSLKKSRTVKDALLQFRSACGSANMASLSNVCRFFMSHSEGLVTNASSRLSSAIIDLDEVESPQSLLLTAFGGDTTADEEREARQAMRHLWETYRVVLEITRSHQAVEDVYHETAVRACDFCLKYLRKNEFKRLCESLRTHYNYLPKVALPPAPGTGPQVCSASAPETVAKVFDTRQKQMAVAMELGLWNSAHHVAEDLHSLMLRKRPTTAQLASYYAALAKVFWVGKSGQQRFLFHAATLVKHYLLTKEEDSADTVVLAVIASLADSLLPAQSIDGTPLGENDAIEKMSLLTSSSGGPPVAEQLVSEIASRGVVMSASSQVQRIFALLTESSLSLLNHSNEINAAIASLTSSEVEGYVAAIKRVVLVRTLKELAKIYATLSFADFKKKTSIIANFAEVDRTVANLRKVGAVDIKLDYITETVKFAISGNQSESASMESAGIHFSDRSTEQFFGKIIVLIDSDRKALENRKAAIIKKRQDAENKIKQLDEEKLRRAREADEYAREATAKRLAEEARKREAESREKAKQAADLQKAKELQERIAVVGGTKAAAAVAATVDKPLSSVVKELEKTLDAQIKKEKANKLQQRKSEFKRVNLTAKVFRSEEAKFVKNSYRSGIAESDDIFFKNLIASKQTEIASTRLEKEATKKALTPALSFIDAFRAKQLASRKVEYESRLLNEQKAHEEKEARSVIERAFDRLVEEDDEDDYQEYERIADGIIHVDSNQSRDDFKRAASNQ